MRAHSLGKVQAIFIILDIGRKLLSLASVYPTGDEPTTTPPVPLISCILFSICFFNPIGQPLSHLHLILYFLLQFPPTPSQITNVLELCQRSLLPVLFRCIGDPVYPGPVRRIHGGKSDCNWQHMLERCQSIERIIEAHTAFLVARDNLAAKLVGPRPNLMFMRLERPNSTIKMPSLIQFGEAEGFFERHHTGLAEPSQATTTIICLLSMK